MKHWFYLFLYIVVRQYYGRKRRGLELRLYRWIVRGLLGIRRMDRVLSIQIKELHGVKKVVDERIDKVLLWWFGHVERMENDRIAERES